MSNTHHQPPLAPNSVYHIFTHAVENNNLFANNGNYDYFLHQWQKHTEGYMKTYAFCLMPNHLHLSIKTATEAQVKVLELERKVNSSQNVSTEKVIDKDIFSNRIKNCLNGYTQAFNRQQNRKGTLFRSRFGRVQVDNRQYFCDSICYIHHNPIHHFGLEHYHDWGFSSYNMFTQPLQYDETYGLNYETVMAIFGGIQGFIDYHHQYRLNKRYLNIENVVQQIL